MRPDLAHAISILHDALTRTGLGDRICPDAWEAITTIEVVDDHRADSLWRILTWDRYPQRRHQGLAVLAVLRAQAERLA